MNKQEIFRANQLEFMRLLEYLKELTQDGYFGEKQTVKTAFEKIVVNFQLDKVFFYNIDLGKEDELVLTIKTDFIRGFKLSKKQSVSEKYGVFFHYTLTIKIVENHQIVTKKLVLIN